MSRDSNDDRSDTMNPNNDAYWDDLENRYGDDDDDDIPAVAPNVLQDTAGLAFKGRELRLWETAVRWDRVPSERERCGPIVMDRASHFIWAVEQIMECVVSHRCETTESADKRLAKLSELERVAADLEASEASGRWLDSFKRSRSQVDKESLRAYGERLRTAITCASSYGGFPKNMNLYDADRLPEPVLESVGWRRGLYMLSKALVEAIESSVATGAGSTSPWVLIYSGDPLSAWRRPEPGTASVLRLAPDGDPFRWERTFERQSRVVIDGWPADSHAQVTIPRLPFIFPATDDAHGRGLVTDECRRLLDGIRWITEPIADWWDILPTLTALRRAAFEAEWAGLPYAIAGIRIETLADENQDESTRSVVATGCAGSKADALALRTALGRRGYRATVLGTPRVRGATPGITPYEPDSYRRTLSRSAEDRWLLDNQGGRHAWLGNPSDAGLQIFDWAGEPPDA